MTNLRETLAAALNPLLYEIAMGKRDDTSGGALSYEAADAALAVIGDFIKDYAPLDTIDYSRVGQLIEAACTATEGPQDD